MKLSSFLMVTCLLSGFALYGQERVLTTASGQTSFFSETPVENISATNRKGQALLKTSGEIAVRMNMRDFEFPNKLMQEHFNENYLESDRFPTATFSGKLDRVPDWEKEGEYPVSAEGKLTIHGVTQARKLQGTLIVKKGTVILIAEFMVSLADHSIEVPKIVFVKIAQTIQVKANFVLAPR